MAAGRGRPVCAKDKERQIVGRVRMVDWSLDPVSI